MRGSTVNEKRGIWEDEKAMGGRNRSGTHMEKQRVARKGENLKARAIHRKGEKW